MEMSLLSDLAHVASQPLDSGATDDMPTIDMEDKITVMILFSFHY